MSENDKPTPEGIPIGDLLPGAQVVEGAEAAMIQLQMSYKADLQNAINNIGLVRAELERLQAVIHTLQGCIKAIDDALPFVKSPAPTNGGEEITNEHRKSTT